MLKDIVSAEPLTGYRLKLAFEDGAEGTVAVRQLIKFTGVFEPLQDEAYFKQIRVNAELGTIEWPNGADLDPDVLYATVTNSVIDLESRRTSDVVLGRTSRGAMSLNIVDLMEGLFQDRPIFHSEADFQHAFSWHIRRVMPPDGQVRLEFKPFPAEKMYLDIWLPSLGVAIELKYRTQRLVLKTAAGESFNLRNQAAQGGGRYHFIEDIRRLEQVVANKTAKAGFAILLTNDPSYWEPSQRNTLDDEFRLHEGRKIGGDMKWSDPNRPGPKSVGKESIRLKGSYDCIWRDYSPPGKEKYGLFRYLMAEVSRKSIARGT